MADENKPGRTNLTLRPDPVFKSIIGSEATERGLIMLDTQFPQLLTADFLLYVPPGLNLANSIYFFFHTFTMIDLKSENDDFDDREYTKNEIRVDALYLQKGDIKKSDILNLFICAYKPASFFAYMHKEGCRFKQVNGYKWLWRAKVGLQNVAVVVCRDLPFEERYFKWLGFAPTTCKNWRKLVATLVRTGSDWELLNLLEGMRPKEVRKIMDKTIDEMSIEGSLPPEYRAQLEANRLEVAEYVLTRLSKRLPPKEFIQMFNIKELLTLFPAEERLAGIPAEERLAGLSPEEKQKLLKTLLEQSDNT